MNKPVSRCLSLLLLLLFFNAQPAFCAEQTPEQLVRDFYAWFFKTDTETEVALFNDKIYTYVAKETVDYARRMIGVGDGLAYFTKFGVDIAWEKMPMTLGRQIAMADDRYVIPVSFKWPSEDREDDIHLVVYVKKENGKSLIYKVSDIYPYS
ncbi:MAG: hypothetical protein FWG04_04705 [Desulfovibrionaceae bacterium]|nr:hypothetical protein [Desulfovibrionaceae bacterium]